VKNPSADESGSAGARGTLRVYNLGGEGEVPGATDVNALKGNRLSEEQIRARNPTGEFVREDIGAFLDIAYTLLLSRQCDLETADLLLDRGETDGAINRPLTCWTKTAE
jgi:hypothetical protein